MNVFDIYSQAESIAAQIDGLGFNTEAISIRDAIRYSSLSSEILVKIRFALSEMKDRQGLPVSLESEIKNIIENINKIMS